MSARMRVAAGVLLATSMNGCVTYRPIAGAPTIAAGRLPARNTVRVTTRRGDRLQLADARAVGDSLIGTRTANSPAREAIALADITGLELGGTDNVRTAQAVVVAAGLTVIGLALFVMMHSD